MPVLSLLLAVVWPAGVAPRPSAALESGVTTLLAKMSVEEKVAQCIQPSIAYITPEEVRQYHFGSVVTIAEWVAKADAFYDASMDTAGGRQAIPILWGADAVHGQFQSIPVRSAARRAARSRVHQGLRGNHILATAKHSIGDGGTAGGKDQGDHGSSESELRDIHGAGYVAALKAGDETIMASFSSWHGVKMHGNHALLTGVLKDRMGFDGFVVGDWNGHGQVPGCTNDNCPQSFNAGTSPAGCHSTGGQPPFHFPTTAFSAIEGASIVVPQSSGPCQ